METVMLTQTITHGAHGRTTRTGELPDLPFQDPARQGALDLIGASLSFGRNEENYGGGEPADFLYKVVSGTVRTSKLLADGRRQIGAFYLPGDMFGLETGQEHAFSAEA